MARSKVGLHARPAQIEIPVFHPQVFVDGVVGVDAERRHLRTIENLQFVDADLDVAGSEPRVFGARGAAPYGAAQAQNVFVTQVLGIVEARVLRIENDLGNSLVVAQVDEDQSAVVAPPIDPTVELDVYGSRRRRATPHTRPSGFYPSPSFRVPNASLMPET